jgi:hypothetical protein
VDQALVLLQAWRDAEAVLSKTAPNTADRLRARTAVEDAREAYHSHIDLLHETEAQPEREPRLAPSD